MDPPKSKKIFFLFFLSSPIPIFSGKTFIFSNRCIKIGFPTLSLKKKFYIRWGQMSGCIISCHIDIYLCTTPSINVILKKIVFSCSFPRPRGFQSDLYCMPRVKISLVSGQISFHQGQRQGRKERVRMFFYHIL